jgi:ubiquinone/menaquinone biosynthesis C-methylase UbiE
MELLEFGCGSGDTAIAHAPRVKHIQAIHISKNMLGVARCSGTESSPHTITFFMLTIDKFWAPDESLKCLTGSQHSSPAPQQRGSHCQAL